MSQTIVSGPAFLRTPRGDASIIRRPMSGRSRAAGLPTRAATAGDAPAVAALVNSAYRGESSRAGWTTEADLLGGQRVDVEEIRALIAAPGHVILVHDGPVIGD